MKKIFSDNLMVGMNLVDVPFHLKNVIKEDKRLIFYLSDSKGDCIGYLFNVNNYESVCTNLIDQDLIVSGLVEPTVDGTVIIKITSFAGCSNSCKTDFNFGLSDEKMNSYFVEINSLIESIDDDGLKALCRYCLSDYNLKTLANRPASLSSYGKYNGGALSATVVVSRMAIACMKEYVFFGNGFTTQEPNWDALICAALLVHYGTISFFTEEPFSRTKNGVIMGYFLNLCNELTKVRNLLEEQIDDEVFGLLLNILAVALSDKTDITAVTKDGIVLKSILSMYGECDLLDREVSDHNYEEDSFFYSTKARRYLVL